MLAASIAVSHNPFMHSPHASWPELSERVLAGRPRHPLALSDTTTPNEYEQRLAALFDGTAKTIEAAKPDVLLVLCSDDGRLFSAVQVPQLWTFLGPEIWGARSDDNPAGIVTLQCHGEVAASLHADLVAAGFDMSYAGHLNPLGRPELGAPAALFETVRRLGLEATPVVPLFINAHVEPAVSGYRCYELGAAAAEALSRAKERVVLLASGGLSHDYGGPRAGWVDEPLDEWVVARLQRGNGQSLGALFDVESDSVVGGAAEMRLWAAAAGAGEYVGAGAETVDRFSFWPAAAGVAAVTWSAPT